MPTYTITTDQTFTLLTDLPALPAGTKLAVLRDMVVGWEGASQSTVSPITPTFDLQLNIALITQQCTAHPSGIKVITMHRNLGLPPGTLNAALQHMLRQGLIRPAQPVAKGCKPAYILTPEQA